MENSVENNTQGRILDKIMECFEKYVSQPVDDEQWHQMWRDVWALRHKPPSGPIPTNASDKGLSDAEWDELLG
jgi:hypothetical protein